MRISKFTRFPHPILADETKDYINGEFFVGIEIHESKRTAKVRINYNVVLTEPQLTNLINDGYADIGLFIVCRRTYYNQFHLLNFGEGEIEFTKGELRDTVILRPIICATKSISKFSISNLHEEFSGTSWYFEPSDILAIGPEAVIEVGLNKLSPMETIFNLETNNEVPDGETRLMLESDKIAIVANTKTAEGIHAMRGTRLGQVALLNGVYLPAIMAVLDSLTGNSSAYENYRWNSIFMSKCIHLNINIENPNLLESAQSLLRSPLGRMLNTKEFKVS